MTYKHFNLVRGLSGVSVHDPRWPDNALYVADSVEAARRWISAYRDGVTWAVQAALLNGGK